jgi:hypothetical protein
MSTTTQAATVATRSSGQDTLSLAPKPRVQQTLLVEVSSRDRNYTLAPAANPFRFVFQRPLKDVQTVELLAGTIPAYPYTLDTGFNTFMLLEGTSRFLITLPPSFYTPATLVAALGVALNALSGRQNTYKADLDAVTGQLVVTLTAGSTVYSFIFRSGTPADDFEKTSGALLQINTPATILGFSSTDATAITGTLRSPYPVDTTLTRLYLYLNVETTQSLSIIERGMGRRSPFAIIYMDQATGGYKFLNKETIQQTVFRLPQTLNRLQTLQVEIRDEFYRLVNFGGKDFTLLLQFSGLVA